MQIRRFTFLLTILPPLLLMWFSFFSNTAKAQISTDETENSLPSFKVAGFVQQQFIADQTPDSPVRFSIHRARLGVTGSITENISINLIGGYAEPPSNTPRLVNVFVDFDVDPLLQIRTGQFLLPFGLEGPQPIFLNDAIERTNAVRRLNPFTMFRDIGVQVSGRHSAFNYAVAVVNGNGANQTEQFNPKDVMGRLGLTLVDNLEFGGSLHFGQYLPDPLSENHQSRFRAGADISYNGNPVFVKSEYIYREIDLTVGGSQKMNGAYLLAGYNFTENLEGIARYEYFEPNTASDDDHLTAFLIGANYYFVGNTRISINYEFRNDRLITDLGNLFTVQMQIGL